MSRPSASALVDSRPPFVHVVEATDDLDDWLDEVRASADDAWVRVLDGRTAGRASALFDQAAEVMDLPSYFGRNWNAFQDVLYDLPGGPKLLVVTDADDLLADEPPSAFATFVSILRDSAQRRTEAGAQPLHLVLVARDDETTTLARRVAAAGEADPE